MKDNMINSKLDIDDSKTLNDSHTVRINVVIDYFIEKDILINGEIKPKDDIEENNQKIGKNKNSKASSGKSTANKSNKSKKDTKTNGKKKKGKKKK
jgi:mannitol-specific phosphotransferase system IIBC component